MSEENKQWKYTIITNEGYYGHGDTILEAAKNAHVKGKWVYGQVYESVPGLVNGNVECGDFGQGRWTYDRDFVDALPEAGPVRNAILNAAKARIMIVGGDSNIRIRSGNLEVQHIINGK